MAYNNKNKLKLIYIVQCYYLEQKPRGITVKRIWEDIDQLFPMSIKTFYNYLGVNVKKKLKEIDTDFKELNKFKDYAVRTIQNFEG